MKIKSLREDARVIAATGQLANPDEPIDVDTHLAKSLLEQTANWAKASSKNKTSEED